MTSWFLPLSQSTSLTCSRKGLWSLTSGVVERRKGPTLARWGLFICTAESPRYRINRGHSVAKGR
jgi:hypothetical protein